MPDDSFYQKAKITINQIKRGKLWKNTHQILL
jgi:hypothetical protein